MSHQDLEHTQSNNSKVCVTCGERFSDGDICPADGGLLARIEADPLIGTRFVERYEIISLIGRGGMSAVYKARHMLMDRLVAIKLLVVSDVVSLRRFQLEAKLASNLRHPNIVTVFDFGVASNSGQPYLVMDYLDGHTLAHEIATNGAMNVDRAVAIFVQACDALVYAHKRDLVHRDLKPSNFVLVNDEYDQETVKLVDFGIAKLVTLEAVELTKSGEIFGSPLYMSPEQCQGKKLDLRTDIYSMGCVMYECLTGRPPLVGADPVETIQKHMYEAPRSFASVNPALLSIPEQLENIVFKCLERDLERRYQSALELWTDLELFMNTRKPAAQQIRTHSDIPVVKAPLHESRATNDSGGDETGAIEKVPEQVATSRARRALLTVATLSAVSAVVLLFVTAKKGAPPNGSEKAAVRFQAEKEQGELDIREGRYVEATRHLKIANQLAQSFDEHDPRVASILNDLGNVYYKRDLYPEAEKCLTRALEVRTEVYGRDGRPVADTMNDLGGVYIAENRNQEAESLLKSALDIRKKNQGEESEDYADSLKALAVLYNKTGREGEALDLLRKTLKIRKKHLGESHPDIAETENSLAMDYQIQGDLEHAQSLYSSALSIAERALGPDHPLVADSLVGLASVAFLDKQYGQSEKLFKRALKIRQKALGANSLRTGEVLSCLGVLKDTEGRYVEALDYYKQSLTIKELALGPDHPEVRRSLKIYSQELRKLGRDQEARTVEARLQTKAQQRGKNGSEAVANSQQKKSRNDKERRP